MKTKIRGSNPIIESIETGELKLKFTWINKNSYGEIDQIKNEICINLALILTEILIHEYLHGKFTDYSESKIRKKTRKMKLRLTRLEILRIANLLIKNFLAQHRQTRIGMPHRKHKTKISKCIPTEHS